MIRVLHGDCREILPTLGEPFHACVCDPPYGLEFMGVAWDTFSNGPKGRSRPKNEWGDFGSREHARQASEVARINRNKNRVFEEFSYEWACKVFDALLPGAYLVAFGGTRTWHRMVCAIEDAGFEVRDTCLWMHGQGFPKSANAERSIDVELCTLPGRHFQSNLPKPEKRQPEDHICPSCTTGDQWEGWHTALKPAWEPIVVARRPLVGNLATNVLAHGTGALHVDACRVAARGRPLRERVAGDADSPGHAIYGDGLSSPAYATGSTDAGRWPANVLHSGDEQVEAAFAAFGEKSTGNFSGHRNQPKTKNTFGAFKIRDERGHSGDTGSPSRYFQRCAFSPDELRFNYSAKADTADRADSRHATIKPISLLRWLVRLVTPPGGHILDPFAGSGTTGEAAMLEGFDCTLIEQDAQHVADIQHRIKRWSGGDTPLFKEAAE